MGAVVFAIGPHTDDLTTHFFFRVCSLFLLFSFFSYEPFYGLYFKQAQHIPIVGEDDLQGQAGHVCV